MEKHRWERGLVLCDFWLSPLATALPLLLDTLPGCPLACHLFNPPSPFSFLPFPPFPPFFPRPQDRPCRGATRWLMCVTHASGNHRRLNLGEIFLFLLQRMQRWHTEERGHLEKVSKIGVTFDGYGARTVIAFIFNSSYISHWLAHTLITLNTSHQFH